MLLCRTLYESWELTNYTTSMQKNNCMCCELETTGCTGLWQLIEDTFVEKNNPTVLSPEGQ